MPRPIRPSTFVMLFGLALAAYWVGFVADVTWLRLAAKPWPAWFLALWVAGARSPLARPVAVGLALGGVGDVVLEAGHFVPGLIAFLLGHLAYVFAFIRAERRPFAALAAPFFGFVTVLIGLLWPRLGPMQVPVAVYASVIAAMMWRAAARARSEEPLALLGLAGALLFALSDSVIAINRFWAPVEHGRVAILVLYWLSQLLIAGSVPRGHQGDPARARS